MAESRFERWSRLKAQVRQEEELQAPDVVPGENEQSEEELELAANEELSDEEILAKYELPDPDVVELGMDVKGFMRKEIPEALRRRALRSLWRSNPVLAVLDGLNDYDEDFNLVTTGAEGVQTLYQVGKGMFDKVKRAEEKLQELADEQARAEIQGFEPNVEIPINRSESSETAVTLSGSDSGDGETVAQWQLPEHDESEAVISPVVRYKPRMSFN